MNEKKPVRLSHGELKKKFDRALLVTLGATVAVVGVGMLILTRPTVSQSEKRTLATFPTFSLSDLWSGAYGAGINTYYSDTVPLRDTWMELANTVKEWTGFRIDGVKIHGGTDLPDVPDLPDIPDIPDVPTTTDVPVTTDVPGSSDVPVTTDAPETTAPTTTAKPETTAPTTTKAPVDEEGALLENGILEFKDYALMMYGGYADGIKAFAAEADAYQAALGSATRVWSMVIPTAVEFYLPEKYASYTNKQKPFIDYANRLLTAATAVDAYGALAAHTSEPIYLKTDHHWAYLGAYYAAGAFAKAANLPYADLASYEKIEVADYLGTMYTAYGATGLKKHPETFVYYKPTGVRYATTDYGYGFDNPTPSALFYDWLGYDSYKEYRSGMYSVALGGDKKVVKITTDVANGRKLVINKSSYGNALVPFLVGSFEEIIVTDFRYFDLNLVNFCREQGATDLLFAFDAYFACTCSDSLAAMRTR